ncbi:MAG: glycosyltransferase [Bacteroidales bacterium]|jgi:glycosyltransferase involved in cell wall biosynthesis
MDPKLSVILPFHNSESTLAESVKSILDQDFTDFELLLINNNSSDSGEAIARRFAKKDKRVLLFNEPKQGIVHALNTGIAKSRGVCIARMDADDISLPERFSLQVRFLDEHQDTGLVATCVEYAGNNKLQSGFFDYVQWNNRLISHEDISVNRFVESPLVHPTVVFRKELPEKYGTYRDGLFPEDYELWLNWLQQGIKMHKLPEKLLIWKDDENRLSRVDERYSTPAFYEMKTVYLSDWLAENNPFHPEVVIWGAGRRSRQRYDLLHDLGIRHKFHIDLHANPARNVIEYTKTPPAGKHFILSYVGNRNAREQIREFLVNLGYKEGKTFLCVA